jgi:hypothetical protein
VKGVGDSVLATVLAVLTLATVVVVDGLLTFPDAGPGTTVASVNTLTIRPPRTLVFDPSRSWWDLRFEAPNYVPAADAGPDRTVPRGTLVRLHGRDAEDGQGDRLTFSWRFLEKPAGSLTVLVGARMALPIFLADRDGLYVIELVVSDGQRESAPDRVRITVGPLP